MLPSEEMETFHLGETGAIKLRLRRASPKCGQDRNPRDSCGGGGRSRFPPGEIRLKITLPPES